ncbi:MAG TPA: hypothetical protein VGO16_10900 [Pseudonocardiaceae bacterium]|jgi:Tol biopolymer transport system component|nr:hypothetical protein [Pseudonocardiaceae bacterium]
MMNNDTRAYRRWRRRAITVIGLGIAMVTAVAVPALAHPSFPNGGPGFPNPNGGTGAGTQTPPYAPGSSPTLNLRVPFERDGVIFNGAVNTTVDIKATVPNGWTNPVCGTANTSVGSSQVGTAVPGWNCALETTADGHKVLHWSGPQVGPTQTAADSAQFFTFQVTVPSPANQTSYGANGGPEGFFLVQQYADPSDTSIWKCPNDPRPATDVATGLVRTVAGTSPPPPTPTPLPPPVVSPSEGKIVFQSGRDGNNEIYLMNADGSGVTRLTNNPASDTQPALSPDGARIAFTSNRDGNNEIYVMNADGTGLTRLTNNPASDSQPVFSPDGTQIAFTRTLGGGGEASNNEIFVMNAFTGASQTNLTNNPAGDDQPAFSPDGRIGFVRFQNANRDIYLMNANGTGQTNLTNNPASDGGVMFGPGGRIAFYSDRDGNNEIYLMNANGTGVTRLTNNPADDQRPAFSPDGTKIVFSSERSGNREVSVTKTNRTSGVLNLTNNPAVDDWARWAPIPGTATTTTLSVTQIPLPPAFGRGGYALPIARVAPFNAAGTVQFKDGSTNIGAPARVHGDVAFGGLVSLPPGPRSLTATFIPAKLAAFQLSTSNTVAFTF